MRFSGKDRPTAAIALLAMASSFCAQAALTDIAADIQRRALTGAVVTHSLTVPLVKLGQMLTGAVRVEHLVGNRCRSTLMLTHEQPFERRGLLITSYARRSVQESACPELASHLLAQAEQEADIMAERIGESTLAARAPTALTPAVLTHAAQLVSVKPTTMVATLQTVSRHAVDYAAAPELASNLGNRGLSRYRITVIARAVLRDQPSFQGLRAEMVPVGYLGIGRSVPGHIGWFEIVLKGKPLYIHESVVAQGPVA